MRTSIARFARLCGSKSVIMQSYVAIVDDDAPTREALARLLRVHGTNSQLYPSARAFLEALPSNMPYCLIADVNMPDMTGLELRRELLNSGVSIPTIVITASNAKSIAADAVSLGAVAFFVKPVPGYALMAAIHSVAKRRHHTRFDADRSSIVVDWLDACRSGRWNALLDLYEEQATLRCDCDSIGLVGRNSLAVYWKSKLESRAASAFTLDGMILTGDEIQVDCQSCKGKPVRFLFGFGPLGKILHTKCGPLPRPG